MKLILNFLRSTSTPSPSSPSPGPSPRSSSSVASMSSAGSNSSATNMAGPCTSVTIPVDMYEKSYQYLQQTKYLFRAHGFWEEAESLVPQIQGRKRICCFCFFLTGTTLNIFRLQRPEILVELDVISLKGEFLE